MKASYGFCGFVALLFCAVAWLISLLLADNLFNDAPINLPTELVLLDIQTMLSNEPNTELAIEELESSYELFIVAGDGATLTDTAYAGDVQEYETKEITLDDGRIMSVVAPLESIPFFTPREWLHLALQSLAALATVGTTILVMNNRLKVLEGATRDTQFSDVTDATTDPVEKAVCALNYAKQNILQLSETQKSSAADHRDLLASVAHEFRNPLARLQFANEMAMERTGDEQKALFEEANTAAVELDELVRETLRYSRINSLEFALTREQLPIEDIFRDIAESASSANSSIVLRIQYPEQDYHINADRRLFTRALTNLVDNGMRYAQNTVTLSVKAQGSTYVIAVKDDGHGIPTIHHDKLFEPFYRVEPSRSRETGGFGLGLSIVKSICDRHGADVSVTSDSDGTSFSITFPT